LSKDQKQIPEKEAKGYPCFNAGGLVLKHPIDLPNGVQVEFYAEDIHDLENPKHFSKSVEFMKELKKLLDRYKIEHLSCKSSSLYLARRRLELAGKWR